MLAWNCSWRICASDLGFLRDDVLLGFLLSTSSSECGVFELSGPRAAGLSSLLTSVSDTSNLRCVFRISASPTTPESSCLVAKDSTEISVRRFCLRQVHVITHNTVTVMKPPTSIMLWLPWSTVASSSSSSSTAKLDGLSEGTIDGACDGVADGDALGLVLGWREGRELGDVDGTEDGAPVGEVEGAMVLSQQLR